MNLKIQFKLYKKDARDLNLVLLALFRLNKVTAIPPFLASVRLLKHFLRHQSKWTYGAEQKEEESTVTWACSLLRVNTAAFAVGGIGTGTGTTTTPPQRPQPRQAIT
jgi:hypothetical protein